METSKVDGQDIEYDDQDKPENQDDGQSKLAELIGDSIHEELYNEEDPAQ
jgi:hypothetical protein